MVPCAHTPRLHDPVDRRAQILVDADADDTLRMKEALEKVPDFMAEVLTPKLKQILDVSSTANIIQVSERARAPDRFARLTASSPTLQRAGCARRTRRCARSK